MATLQLIPGDGAPSPMTSPGTKRTYSGSVGAFTAVPDFDAGILRSAGWVSSAAENAGTDSGTTAQRPTNASPGFRYHDTTLGALVVFVGKKSGWVHTSTAASA